MTLAILAGLAQIICVELIIGLAVLATSLWWAAYQRFSDGDGK